jgi:hypothetical protein
VPSAPEDALADNGCSESHEARCIRGQRRANGSTIPETTNLVDLLLQLQSIQ